MRLSEKDRPKKLTPEEQDQRAKDMLLGAAVVLVPLFLIDWYFFDMATVKGMGSTFLFGMEILWMPVQEWLR